VSEAGIKIQNANYDAQESVVVIKGKVEGFGEQVRVTASNLSTGQLLGESVTDKQFLYKVPVSSFSQVPCEVLVVAGGEIATAEVGHGPGVCARYEVSLTGVVTDEPIPNATVSVTLDGVTYTTTADETGFYSLDLVSANLNQLVKIEAAGTSESGTPVEFTNLTGSFSRVLDGNASGNVTNVTTASYVLTLEANGGTEPTTADELAAAETSVDATELFELAALIKLIVDDRNYSLPEGETSLIAFISNPEAVQSYIETEVNPADLDAAFAAILADSNLVAGFTAADIPERYYAIPVASPGFIARVGDALEFDSAGTGAFLNKNGLGQGIAQGFSWFIDSGRLVIDLDNPVVEVSFTGLDESPATDAEKAILADSGITQIQENRAISRYTYTRVTDGTLVDIARVETRVDVSYPPVPLADGSTLTIAANQRFEISSSETTLRSSLDIEPIPFSSTCNGQALCVTGVWGGEFHYPNSPGTSLNGYQYPATAYGDVMTFSADGSGSGLIAGSAPNWSVGTEGELILEFGNGMVQTMRVLDENNGEYGIYSDYDDGNSRFGSYSVYTRADARPVLTEADVISAPNSYFNGEVNSWIPGSFDANGAHAPARRFGWQLDQGGTGRRTFGFVGSCGPVNQIDPISWQLNEQGDIELSYFGRTRTWYPAAVGTIGGDRVIYVLEVDKFNWGGLVFPARLNIQREIPEYTDWCFVDDRQ